MCIVDHTEKGALGRPLRQKPQRSKANVEPIGVPALLKAECPPQRVALGSRQHIDVAKTGSNELVEGGEAELHFALDALQMAICRSGLAAASTYSRSDVLPTPGSPRSMSTPLSPRRVASTI